MLTLVSGCDRTVLSRYALNYIHKAAETAGQAWVIVVPEQFSFETERRLCEIGGDTISRYAEVLSFSRLADRVASKEGGVAGAYLDRGGQLLTMALAAEQVVSRMKLYASVLRKPEFLCDMVRMIEELRSYCIEPRQLLEASRREQGQFAQKLEELGLLYEAYLAACANGKADPADKLLRLLDDLENCQWIGTVRFYIDGFSDFTGAEQKILQQLMRYSPEVRVNIPCGPGQSVVSRTAHKTQQELRGLAEGCMVNCTSQYVDEPADRAEGVEQLLYHMFTYADALGGSTDAVRLVSCDDVEQECRRIAWEVRRLLSSGARCRDISVAYTDQKQYEVPLYNALLRAGVPAYFAGERELLSKPVVMAVINSLFAAAGPMEYEDVALYLRSGLAPLEAERCDRLDNYGYLWNLRATGWTNRWTLHPRGFGEAMTQEDTEYLSQLNCDKAIALAPLENLRKGLLKAKKTGDMVLALHDFLEEVKLRQRLEEKANAYAEQGMGQKAQELTQLYEILITSMEQMWLTVGQTERTAEDFCRLYQMVLTQYEVATIPAGLDQVHVSDLPDLRNRQTRHLLIAGASDGSFPAYQTAEGLLTEEERLLLAKQGVCVAPGRADRMDRELSKIYFALSAAQESVWLSYCAEQPAWLFRRAAALYPGALCEAEQEIILNAEELEAWYLRHDDVCTADGENQELRQRLLRSREYEFTPLGEETVHGLYGTPISLSPSRIDLFAACRFAFFLNYGLKSKPKKQAKLDQPAFGTFVHAVLEHTVLRVKEAGGFPAISREQILEIAAEEINRYAEEFFPEQASREEYLFKRSKKEIHQIVLDLWEELRRSKFQPEYCELKFTGGQELPPVKISGERASCQIIGMVDRVDLYREQDKTYVRVVDYKTGVKDFDYTDILNGAGLQMLIYLFALQSSGKELMQAQKLEPAGVLYVPAKKEYPLTEPMPEQAVVDKEHRDRVRRKGLIRSDGNLLAAMEEDPENPLFMPYKMGRNGLTGDLADARQMELLERHVVRSVAAMADEIARGEIGPNPVVRGQYGSCKYCDYKTVCHKDMNTQQQRILAQTGAAKFWEKLEQEEHKHG